jgi:Ca2+-binding RTX toxin-like protein
MSCPPLPRTTLFVPSLALIVAAVSATIIQPACGRSDLEIECVAFRYTVDGDPFTGKLLAVFVPSEDPPQDFPFNPPSIIVNLGTHEALQDGYHAQHELAETQLRLLLGDATREICRLTLEEEVDDEDTEDEQGFDFRVDGNNCNSYTPAGIEISHTAVESSDLDDPGPPVVLNPVCHASCLLEDCSYDETGGYDPSPEHPFVRTVHCRCQLEEMGTCSPPDTSVFPDQLPLTDDFCVPEDEDSPAEYCRIAIADYFTASIRAINNYGGVAPFGGYDGTCGDYVPAGYNVVVECLPVVEQDLEIETSAAEAYTEQNDDCAPGCSNLSCDELQNESGEDRPCTYEGDAECSPQNCTLDEACDCDLLPEECFEDEVVDGVCLPEPIGGADGGSDDGDGDAGRLRSAINLLPGSWLVVDEDFQCSEIEPGGFFTSNANPPPSSAVSPYALTNGTTFTTGLHHTCPAPSTDDVEISTYETSLEELCRLIPLCEFSSELELTITASEDETQLVSGTLEKSGATITTTEDGAPLSVGEHTLDLCVEHEPSEVEACSAQSIRAAAPLGSGVDGFGYFAGELAPDFVPIASKPGAIQLSLTNDNTARVSLPSGFDFPFYGTTVSTYLYVGANGGINTTNAAVAAGNTHLPASTSVNAPDIAVYWDDLDPSSGGGVYAWFDGVRFIVSWEDVPHGRDGGSTTTDGVSVQAHIYASGRIELHYLDTNVDDADYDLGKSATIGIGNIAGTRAVEVTYDSNALLTADVVAIGIAHDEDGCLADGLVIPPQVACSASDHYLTVCTPTGDEVTLPLPDVSECASGSVGVEGEVIESGTKESTLAPLSSPIPIDESGNVELDEGAHQIRWWPIDEEDEHVGPAFTQIVLVGTWVHDDCGGGGQSLMLLTDDDDEYEATEPGALALLGLPGDDVLVSGAGDDFIGDGSGAGICEALGGADQLAGEDGDDTLDGGPGDDRAWGGTGDDLLVGGAGADELHGQGGHDILQGGADADALWGGLGDDVLEGGDGADTLVPGAGIDAVYGDAGDDTIIILDACELTSGKLLSGGDGTDTLVLPPGLVLQAVVAAGVTVGTDIESVVTSTTLPTHRAACEAS